MGRALALLAAALAAVGAACSQEPVAVPVTASSVPGPDAVVAATTTAPAAVSGTERAATTTVPAATTSTAATSTTASVEAPSTTAVVEMVSSTDSVAPSETAEPAWPPEWPAFVEGPAPGWPFHGVVQLWPDYDFVEDADGGRVGLELFWSLRYWSWDVSPDGVYPLVSLPGLRVECLGQVALVHDEHGVEVGGGPGAASAAFRVPWGGAARELDRPSEELLAEAEMRSSSVAVGSVGDWVRLGSGDGGRSYAMRDPARPGGERWRVQARHDGELFMLTVHPAHLRCYSGVTWLSLADTGEFVMCGANSAATAFVSPAGAELGELVLPDPGQMGVYLSCAAQFDLYNIPLTADRRLS